MLQDLEQVTSSCGGRDSASARVMAPNITSHAYHVEHQLVFFGIPARSGTMLTVLEEGLGQGDISPEQGSRSRGYRKCRVYPIGRLTAFTAFHTAKVEI